MRALLAVSLVLASSCASQPPSRTAPAPAACAIDAVTTRREAWLRAAGAAALAARQACAASSYLRTAVLAGGEPGTPPSSALACEDRARAEALWALTDRALYNALDAVAGRDSATDRRDRHAKAPDAPPALAASWRAADAFRAADCRPVEPGPIERQLLKLRAPEQLILGLVELERVNCGPLLERTRGPQTVCVSAIGWTAQQTTRAMAEVLASIYGMATDPQLRASIDVFEAGELAKLGDQTPLELDAPPGLPQLAVEPRDDGAHWWVFRPEDRPATHAPLFAVRALFAEEQRDDACENLESVPALFGHTVGAGAWRKTDKVVHRKGCMLRASAVGEGGEPLELMVAHSRTWPDPARFFAVFPQAETDKYMASALIAISSARWVPWNFLRGQPVPSRLTALSAATAGGSDDALQRSRRKIGFIAERELRRIYALLAHAHWQHRHAGAASVRELSSFALARTPQVPDCRAPAWPPDSAWSSFDFRPEFDLPFAFELGPAKSFGVDDPDTMLLLRAHGDQDCDGTTSLHELALAVGAHDALLAADGIYVERGEE